MVIMRWSNHQAHNKMIQTKITAKQQRLRVTTAVLAALSVPVPSSVSCQQHYETGTPRPTTVWLGLCACFCLMVAESGWREIGVKEGVMVLDVCAMQMRRQGSARGGATFQCKLEMWESLHVCGLFSPPPPRPITPTEAVPWILSPISFETSVSIILHYFTDMLRQGAARRVTGG